MRHQLAVSPSPARTTDPFARAILSGFVASATMQVGFAFGCALVFFLGGSPSASLSWPAAVSSWFHALRDSGLVDLGRPTLYQATGVYLAAGLVWAIVYAHTLQRWMSGPPWERGLLFAGVPWLFSIFVLLPLTDAGPLGMAVGAGPLLILGSLVLHALYGVTLAALCGPFGDVVLGSSGAGKPQVVTLQNAERRAAGGVIAGVSLGAALGFVLAIVQSATGSGRLGLHPLSILVATTVSGAALGGLLGSFYGLAAPED